MKRKSSFILAAALAGVLAAGAGGALAYGGCDGEGHGGRGGFGPLAAVYRLDDLSAEQRKQLDGLRDLARKQRDQMHDDRESLDDAMTAGADAKTLRPLAEKHGKNVAEAIMHRAELRASLDKILTDAQRKELAEMKDARQDRGHGQPRGMDW